MFDNKKKKIWTILGIIIFVLVIYFLSKHTRSIESILFKSGPLAPLIAIILYPLLAPTPITTDPVTVVVGVIYGPFAGFLIAWIGNTLAALVEYYLGAKIEQATNFEGYKEKLPFGLGKLPIDSVGVLIFGRMIPGYGGKIISILAGVYKVPIKRFLWTTAITNLLGSFLLAYGGFGLVHFIKNTRILKYLNL
jgi:uncharacterized membrane protein YdjX (TVP38/TMEM64 family)